MEPWVIVAVVGIVAGSLGGMYRQYLRHRDTAAGKVDAELAQVKARLDALEDRVGGAAVVDRLNALETIVTDSRFELEREFKRLGDTARTKP